jgi:hypothetical protein
MEQEEDHVRQPSIFDQFFDDPVFEEPKPMKAPPPIARVVPVKKELEKRPLQVSPLTAGSIPELKKREMRVSTLRSENFQERRKIKTSFDEEEEKVRAERSSIMDGFSGKKAIIYAEILKRKY